LQRGPPSARASPKLEPPSPPVQPPTNTSAAKVIGLLPGGPFAPATPSPPAPPASTNMHAEDGAAPARTSTVAPSSTSPKTRNAATAAPR